MQTPLLLVILDGFGYRINTWDNAISHAYMPTYQLLMANYRSTLLHASGSAVGLLPNMIGNSEAGHITIGAGRRVPQPVTIIHNAIDDGLLEHHPILKKTFSDLVETNKRLHVIGLLSDAGIHSHTKHLYAYLDIARRYALQEIIIHAIVDGRDSPPRSAMEYLKPLDTYNVQDSRLIIGSVHGRFYAMDRDKNWDRTEQSYRVLTQEPDIIQSWQTIMHNAYQAHISDEFIKPVACYKQAPICNGDVLLCINIRPERSVQLIKALIDTKFDHFARKNLTIPTCITPVIYPDVATDVLFESQPITDTLKELLSERKKRILSIAESEKYAHITYFLSGGKTDPFAGETQQLIPSRSVTTYAQWPCMSAPEITDAVLRSLQESSYDIYLINYANPDMVGHSGNLQATIQALNCLDQQLKRLYQQAVLERKGLMIITADHGKAEEMWDIVHQQPRTAHTKNPVPFLVIGGNKSMYPEKLPEELSQIKAWIVSYIDQQK